MDLQTASVWNEAEKATHKVHKVIQFTQGQLLKNKL